MSVLERTSSTGHQREGAECLKIMVELKEDDNPIANLRSSVKIYQELSQEEPLKTN